MYLTGLDDLFAVAGKRSPFFQCYQINNTRNYIVVYAISSGKAVGSHVSELLVETREANWQLSIRGELALI